MAKKTTVKNVRNANIPEKLRRQSHAPAPTSPGTMSRVWETVKKLWIQRSKPTSLRVSKELGIDLEKACDATKNLSDEGYLYVDKKLRRSSADPYQKRQIIFCKKQLKPNALRMDSEYARQEKLKTEPWNLHFQTSRRELTTQTDDYGVG